ncbi:S-adenosyl-L-methionine-dependent methyltransferase [Catenaria anguillulae PL171]|uniref:Leucine carboxyl methyltransferase 1 n=1 Tax=Catenaria anguillulae PL171 TaxID=765915 RepID=A0A1Y2HB07_9FUNG|nr:S-adenosyl-L-methionine-dependent methyltransferase [Catenaria anguillulae PL171]
MHTHSAHFAHNNANGDDDDTATIRATDNVAAQSRLSAVDCGYITDDPYAVAFVSGASGHALALHRRPPLINRGTYLRISAFDWALDKFIQACSGAGQVVSLGAGTDTRWFRFRDKYPESQVKCFEIDLQETVLKKISVFRKSARLFAPHVKGAKFDSKSTTYTAVSAGYTLLAGDLRSWSTHCVPALLAAGFDPKLPTLVLAECALVYISPPTAVADIFTWLSGHVQDVCIVTYDQIRPDDDFGRVMVSNLRDAGIELPGLHHVPSPKRMRIEWQCVSEDEKKRIAKVEMLDEVEELELMWAHYCLAVGVKGEVAQEVGRVYINDDKCY